MMGTCKFCDYSGEGFTDCELYSDSETGEVTLCGHKECPLCHSCQGNPLTPERIRAGKLTRAVTERRVIIEKLARLLAGADALRRAKGAKPHGVC